MKRKKGAKGSFNRVKRNDQFNTSYPNSPSVSIEGENNVDQTDDYQGKFEVEIEQPATVDNKKANTSSIDSDVARFKSTIITGYSRVKVKLKASKLLEPHKHSSDIQMASANTSKDTNKRNSQFMSGVNEIAAGKVDDGTCSDSQSLEADNTFPENPTRKPGSIKIKSSRGSDNVEKENFSVKQMESKNSHKDSLYNSKELSAALGVIRKIMKMEAAGPFNAPVNPVALGIPDYFDIINTPMDFGSICNDLEHRTKYKNSLDVYKDVQFIWDNCYKYNNKGDFILELMKRVKKNFMKYWSAAGLLTETSIGTEVEDAWPYQEKSTSKMKSKQKRRRYGIDGHKSNCLCAVCVVRRRRKKREENSAAFESHMMDSHANSPIEPIFEVMSADNPCGECTASSLDRSPETDADAEMDDAGKVETVTIVERTGSDAPERVERISREIELDVAKNGTCLNISHENGNFNPHACDQECHHSNSSKHSDKNDEEGDEEEEDDEIIQQELHQNGQEMKSVENPPQQENKSVLWLCKEFFPAKQKSVWNGPHSLKRRHATAKQNNPIRSALATIFNP